MTATDPATGAPARADATPAAVGMLTTLTDIHGPLLLHQSGGCCDGSAPMCYPRDEFLVGDRDVLLAVLAPELGGGVPFYIGGNQYEYWSHTHLTVDLVKGRGGGFSLEAPEGFRFLTRSRLFTEAEDAAFETAGPAPRGAWAG